MTLPTTPPDQFTAPVDQDAINAGKNKTDAISSGYLLIRKIGIAGAVGFSILCFVAVLSPKRLAIVTTLEEACSSEVAKAEEGSHATFQINNVETLASNKAQVWYEVGTQIGPYDHQVQKDRRTAVCTGTAKTPLVDLSL